MIIKEFYQDYKNLSLKDRSVITSKMSFLYHSSSALIKLVLGFYFSKIFIITAGFYSLGIVFVKFFYLFAVNENKEDNRLKYFYIINILLCLNCMIYLGYSLRYFYYDEVSSHSLVISLAISIFGFTDISIALVGLFKSNKQNDLLLVAIKIVSLTSAFTSLATTQAALLSYDGYLNNINYSNYIGIGSMFFGSINLLISFYMSYLYRNHYTENLTHIY